MTLFSKQNYLTITKLKKLENVKLNPSCVWGKKITQDINPIYG